MSGALRPVRLGHLGDAGRAELVELAAAARRSHDWGPLADRLVRLRAWGVPVAALSAVVGVGESRLRVLCRDHGPDPAAVGDPLADAGWVDTATAARAVLGVSVDRLLAPTARAEADGVVVMVGWTRLWHGPSLPGWWAAQRVESRRAARVRRDARADRVHGLVAGGATVAGAAATVGVSPSSAYRYLRVRGARADPAGTGRPGAGGRLAVPPRPVGAVPGGRSGCGGGRGVGVVEVGRPLAGDDVAGEAGAPPVLGVGGAAEAGGCVVGAGVQRRR